MINQKTTSSKSLLKSHLGIKPFVAMLALAAAGATSAHAQLIDIAVYNPYGHGLTGYMSGSAVLGTTPSNTTDVWNTLDFNSHSFTGLENAATGLATGVSLTTTGFEGNNSSGADSVGGLAPALFESFAFEFKGDGGTSSLNFSGLSDNTDYSLVLYNLNDSTASDTTYTVNGVTSTLLQAGNAAYTSTPTTSLVDPGAVYSGNYVKLTGLTDASGNLTITLGVAPSNSSNGGPQPYSFLAFDGLQLEQTPAAPEPSTFALLAAGLGALVFLGRIRRGFASSI